MNIINSQNEFRLSRRQRQCLELVGKGCTSKEIARELLISPSTVDNHIHAAVERMNVKDRNAAANHFRNALAVKNSQFERELEKTGIRAFKLPPLGGTVNQLSPRRRMWHIVQIALLGVMGMAAVVITIAGLIQLFSGI
jgi:DNA-binding CsgD family transcriptional regulator